MDADSLEMRLFQKFVRGFAGLTAFRTEWMIYGDAERLAGSIDFVASNARGDLVIFDWKRSKDVLLPQRCCWRLRPTLVVQASSD